MTSAAIDRLPVPPDGSVELALLLCTAVRIEPQLIRAARLTLLPHLDVGAEADLWFSSWVAFHEADAIMLRPEVIEYLRLWLASRLADDTAGSDPARRAGVLIARAHAGQSRAVLLEERLAWLSVQPGPVDLDGELMPVLRGAVGGAASTQVAQWFVRAWPRLPEAARQTVTAWKIAQVARARVPGAPPMAEDGVEGIVLADVAEIAQTVGDVSVPVRHQGTDLVLGVAAGDAETLPVPDTDPRILGVTWLGGGGAQSRTVYVPAGGSVTLPVEPVELWLRTARGVLYSVGPRVSGPRVHIPYVFDNDEHHRSVFACWRLLRAAGVDVTVGDGNSWADQRLAESEFVLVVGRAADLVRRQWPERVVSVRLPGSTEVFRPGPRTIDVPELTESGVWPLVELLRGATPPPPAKAATVAEPRATTPTRDGKVVTFYSYEGGSEHTMALANVAWILAANGRRVLVVDFNLDSPGLHRYFRPFVDPTGLAAGGMVDLVRGFEHATTEDVARPEGWQRDLAQVSSHASSLDWDHFPDGGFIDFLAAGNQNRDYRSSVAGLDWDSFYNRGGGQLFDALRADMKARYDYTLINSSAGLSEVADICTAHLPDLLVDCFTFTEQSMEGAAGVARQLEGRPIRILPVPIRVDLAEKRRADASRMAARRRFAGLPSGMSAAEQDEYWLRVQVPYQAYYAYEETLATFADRPGGVGLLAAYERLTAYITDGTVTRLPPMDESVRQETIARFARRGVLLGDTAIAVRFAVEDQYWAEWISEVLLAAGVTVNLAPVHLETASRPTPEGRTLVVVSLANPEFEQSRLRSDGSPLAVYVADVRPLPGQAEADSAFLASQTEEDAVERLLELIGLTADGFDRGRIGLRFPGDSPAVFNAPARNVRFTGREDELADLRARLRPGGLANLSPGTSRVALLGMGGVGKTQIALEYAYRFRNAYDVVWWIYAEPVAFLDVALSELGSQLGILGGSNVVDQVRATLSALERGDLAPRWLMIFDNAEDVEATAQFLPGGSRGHIVVTSRNSQWGDRAESVQEVDVFARRESIGYLLGLLPSIGADEANQLGDLLGDLPIAVAAAGAWLADTGTSVSDYLQQLDRVPPENVDRIWDLALQRLEQRSPAAFRLLQLCSVMASEIALDLVYGDQMAELLRELDPALGERAYRGSIVQEINRLALLKLDRAGRVIQVHRLVQHVVRQRMTAEELSLAQQQVHLVLAAARPTGEVDDSATWRRFRQIWPHLEIVRAWASRDESVRVLVIDRLRYLWLTGDFHRARQTASEFVDRWTEMRDTFADDANRLTLTRQLLQLQVNFANIVRDLADYAEAFSIDRDVHAQQQQLLGEYHPHTLITAAGLGSDLRALGRYDEARALDQETWVRWVANFGKDHPRTLGALINLAISVRLTGDFRRAREHSRQAFELAALIVGGDHTLALAAGSGLGRDLREAGDYQESVTLLQDILRRNREVYGDGSPRAYEAMTNLAVSERAAGQVGDSAEHLETAYESLSQLLGPDSPATLACRLSRALTLFAAGEPAGARSELAEVHNIYRRELGENHPHSIVCRHNLATLMHALGEGEAGAHLADEAMSDFDRVLGPEHPYTLAARVNYAVIMDEAGGAPEIVSMMAAVVERLESVLGVDHPDTIRGTASLLLIRRHLNQHDPDEEGRTLSRLAAVLGSEHPDVVAVQEGRHLHRSIDPHPF